MYCPRCLNNSLQLNSRGVMHIIINGKQMDSGRFLYNLNSDREQLFKDFKVKLEEFFKWYSNFQNVDAIHKVELCTSDVSCENKCAIPLSNKFPINDVIFTKKEIVTALTEMGGKYGLHVELAEE